jgi:CheY-like chemotaxis protein
MDPNQFENALINLAINARDAMSNGGTLVIETANTKLDETFSKPHDEVTPGDYVMVAVSDTGDGIPPEALEKVFEPFFTTKEVGMGSGLGLSMVYGFVKQSGGHVMIDSALNQGTVVKLFMPRAAQIAERDDVVAQPPKIAMGSESILVVEDDDGVRDIAVAILSNQGYKVTTAKNGAEALDLLSEGPNFDLLYTDIVLPGGMNGVEIGEEAVRFQPKIKIIYTTGYTENSVASRKNLNPDALWVNKPYLQSELLQKIRTALDLEAT